MLPSRWDKFTHPFVARCIRSFFVFDVHGVYGRYVRVNVGDIVMVLDRVDEDGYGSQNFCRMIVSVKEKIFYMIVQKRWNPARRFEET